MYKIRAYKNYSNINEIEYSLKGLIKNAQEVIEIPEEEVMEIPAEEMGYIEQFLTELGLDEEQKKAFLEKFNEMMQAGEDALKSLIKNKLKVIDEYPFIKQMILAAFPDMKEYIGDSNISEANYNSMLNKYAGLGDVIKNAFMTVMDTFRYVFDGNISIWKKIAAGVFAFLIGTGYLVIPEPTDLLLGIGWLDEVLMYFYAFKFAAIVMDKILGTQDWGRVESITETKMPQDVPALPDNSNRVFIDEDGREVIDVDYVDLDDKQSFSLAKDLVKIANSLDQKGYHKISDKCDKIIKRLS